MCEDGLGGGVWVGVGEKVVVWSVLGGGMCIWCVCVCVCVREASTYGT